jgi:glycerol-3-phosphate dehydrogenase (NAD(P)+)
LLQSQLGARLETLFGLSGVGDFNLSCSSPRSRNMSLSIALGEGQRLADILAARWTVQKGVHSAESAAALARRHNIEMPITHAVDAVLNHGADLDQAIAELFAHPCGMELPPPSAAGDLGQRFQ